MGNSKLWFMLLLNFFFPERYAQLIKYKEEHQQFEQEASQTLEQQPAVETASVTTQVVLRKI